ncbi:PIG-L deacetylase family protein [Actomonas aquatica]|uniref:PIG-L family deacetylase n=1 Tax=Actomonas aquatica TaxID=2866162 RepID=A0ABZ1C8M6_9BACT|nr:PIG-L family deacetylase [Opitutus sp. WL0086]WRQ87682.1 PIG-L family deacetylase [Opitutus sp. WL0086]
MSPALLDHLYVPDNTSPADALARTTHLAIGAHQDDLEIFAYHGIETCYDRADMWFGGVTVTDGGGSARTGEYSDYSDEQMKAVRVEEQNEAARLGRYAFQAQLGVPSRVIKDPAAHGPVVAQLTELLRATRPDALYLHNPADKHATHIGVLLACVSALRELAPDDRPRTIVGCEVWRDLDWLPDGAKIPLPVGRLPELERDLIAVFRSQVAGGKDYVAATLGRRRANATYFNSHAIDAAAAVTFAMDLSALATDDSLTLTDLVTPHLDAFRADVLRKLAAF